MTPPLVSIIIPAFNYERYVGRAIESALAQDHTPIEIVVVDDGSTDATAAAARAYESRGVRVISQPNQGLAAARNTGIQNSSGELLFFLDADDFLDGDAISRLYSVLTSLNETYGMVACLPRVIEVREGVEHEVALPEEPAELQQEILWRQLVFGTRFPCTVLIRRTVFDRCGLFDPAYHRLGCEDRDMWLRVAAHFRILLLRQRLVSLLFHGGNMSGDPVRQLAGMRRCLDKAKAQALPPPDRLFWRRAESSFQFSACVLWESVGQRGLALRHLLRSLLIYPLGFPRAEVRRPRFFRFRKLLSLFRSAFKPALPA